MRLRLLIPCLMALVLVLTGHAQAIARGATAATGQMVICTGDTTRLVFTDTEGQPTSAPMICPDAALQAPVAEPMPAQQPAGTVVRADLRIAVTIPVPPLRLRALPPSRGPPFLPV